MNSFAGFPPEEKMISDWLIREIGNAQTWDDIVNAMRALSNVRSLAEQARVSIQIKIRPPFPPDTPVDAQGRLIHNNPPPVIPPRPMAVPQTQVLPQQYPPPMGGYTQPPAMSEPDLDDGESSSWETDPETS